MLLYISLTTCILISTICNGQDTNQTSSSLPPTQDSSQPSNISQPLTTNDTLPTNQTSNQTQEQQEIQEAVSKEASIENNYFDPVVKQRMTDLYGDGKIQIIINSIEPEAGPTEGETKVLVRGGPFDNLVSVYPRPKCRFGVNSRIVEATYVSCSSSPTPIKGIEPKGTQKNETCLQCSDSPPAPKGEMIPLTVSLTGDFSDSMNSVTYRYYDTPNIYAMQPRLGYKDGETIVEVWGENFLNFDELSVCNFGPISVKAEFINSTKLLCIAPHSDVVQRAQPFSVSFNKQQNTKQDLYYWFYNRPAVSAIVPNIVSDQMGQVVTLLGQNFHPILPGWNYTNTSFCLFTDLENNIQLKGKALEVDSTKIDCVLPDSKGFDLKQCYVNVTLNDQQYTENVELLYFFKSAIIFDADPREGPTKGGTEVTVYGDRFNATANMTCRFGNKTVRAKYISNSTAKCISPMMEHPGFVPLRISNGYERYSTQAVQYYYYETPEILAITPMCGPVSGYTQITVFGKNFRNIGFGKTRCIFNETIQMNATVFSADMIKCDSPQLQASDYNTESGAPFYFVGITLDSGKSVINSQIKFSYYKDPVIESIEVPRGPMIGNTLSKLLGSGYKQEAACNVTVRYGAIVQNITNVTNFTDSEILITSPPSNTPIRVIVSIALNGQQYINDKVIHLEDIGNTFTYYQDVFVSDYTPKSGPISGKTLVKVSGMGFSQFKDIQNGKRIEEPIWVRFIDSQTGQQIGDIMKGFNQKDDEFSFRTPAATPDTKAIMEISYNKNDWQKIIPPNSTYSYQYYNAPRITSISPAYGPVKSPNDETVTLTGQNFQCPESDCKDLYVRFGDPDNGIFVKGNMTGPNTVECRVPKFTKPDVLQVEVTFNGQDYTNDHFTYGFFDPYILDVQPRLISTKGSTLVRIYGIGFVNSTGTYLKSKFQSNPRGNLVCGNGDCIKMATYIDKSTIETPTFPQNIVNYQDTNDNIQFDGMATEACVYGNTFTENGIEIFYYEDPIYQNLSSQGSPANLEKPLFATTDFQWNVNDFERFKKYSNFTCRFRAVNGSKVVYTKAKMEVYPLGNKDENAKPTHVKCSSPRWGYPEQAILDFSVNGQDFSGNFPYTFYDNLDLYRIYPMAGPNEGGTRVTLFGSGFSTTIEDVFTRWGVLNTEPLNKDNVRNYIWNETSLVMSEAEKGLLILKAYRDEIYNEREYYQSKKKDYDLSEGQSLVNYKYAVSPRLPNWNATHGGPIYMSVGEKVILNATNYTYNDPTNLTDFQVDYYNQTLHLFSHSYIEFYYYQNPVVKKAEPNSGLSRGGTRIEISGAWFKYKPEYGIVPHCKIGDKISRAIYYSTVRIVCLSPPSNILYEDLPIFVSLNGFDFVDSGFKFQYQEQANLVSISPSSGEEGTIVYITGTQFSRFPAGPKFKCRFTDIEGNQPPKYEYVYYKDNTTIQCTAPRGFSNGVSTHLQVTFNGEDYSDNNFTFNFYKINGVFPNSGPTDGNGGPILILGDGFRSEMNIVCNFNGTSYTPLDVNLKYIKCPMPPANRSGITFPTRVDFVFSIDNAQKNQTDGFWYFDQITPESMEPFIGPSVGRGIINFYVTGLSQDYNYFWANPGCKIGDSQGKAQIMGQTDLNQTLIQCIVEEMELVDRDYFLPASVALNSYSWVTNDNFKYIPYGITEIIPNSGPITGNTDVIIIGKGFNEELQEKALCRFGVGIYSVIVQADILEYDKILCRTPPGFTYPSYAELPVSVPVSITLSDKYEFNPWTETAHRFTFYQPPKLIAAEPDEIIIGTTNEVYIFADDDSEFLQPIPSYMDKRPQYDILCRFGKFKDGIGTFLNKTTIKCAVPSIKDDPDTIWRETVTVSIAQNGQNFDDDYSDVEVTFVGTGSPLGFWSAIFATLLIALLIIAIIFYCGAVFEQWWNRKPAQEIRSKDKSYVIKDHYDKFTPRGYSKGMMGRSSPAVNDEIQ